MKLNRLQAQKIIEQMKSQVARPECWTCDCFQGLLTQLELDCKEDIADLTGPVKALKEKMHGCLSCDPCPGGAIYAAYLKGQLNQEQSGCNEGNKIMNTDSHQEKIRQSVRKGYAEIASTGSGCCGSAAPKDFASQIGYTEDELAALPQGANLGLSCGNPTAIANLKPGQVVLDLGSGAGFDVFIAAKKVGPTGKSIGVDMTPQMLDKARNSINVFQQKTGLSNIEFRLGEIEHLPVADASVDVVISNCVINLSADKPQVWREISRVLKPGGKACISDLALKKPLPPAIREMVIALVGCVAGAVPIEDTVKMAKEAGLLSIQWNEKEYAVDIMENCNDKLYQSVKETLGQKEKLSDYVVSANFIVEKQK